MPQSQQVLSELGVGGSHRRWFPKLRLSPRCAPMRERCNPPGVNPTPDTSHMENNTLEHT